MNKAFHTIVTHGGRAHRDDFLVVCILLAFNPQAEVCRRDPTEEELEDPNIWVVDVGMQWDAEKRNFDHHQSLDHDCAMFMVLSHLGLLDSFFRCFKWVGFTNTLDTMGPIKTQEEFNMTKETFWATLSPVESQILQMFGAGETIDASLQGIMAGIGQQLIDYATELGERLELLDGAMTLSNVNGVNVYSNGIEEKPFLGLTEWLEGRTVGVCVCKDDRGPGWTLYRVDDHPAVDFSTLEGEEGIVFAHKGGFIAKTESMSLPEAMVLVEKAVAV